MKKIIYIPLIAIALLFSACGEDFLEQKNLYEVFDTDYYKTPQDIQEALSAAYSCLPGYDNKGASNSPTVVANLMSDDCFGGGGPADIGFHDMDGFSNTTEDTYTDLWEVQYQGIFRTNMIIKRFDQAVFENENERNQALGEAHFLRALFNFRLAQFFGTFPLKKEAAPDNLPKASVDDIFAFIASDLKLAIELMPATKYQAIPTFRLGHATKWAAEALMARVFLFYTGYYAKEDIVLTDGSTLSKNQVITWLDECISSSGHDLIPDFRNQWPYAYANKDYRYAVDNNLQWVGEEGGNYETVFAIKYSPYADWASDVKISYSNQVTLYMAMRNQNMNPFGIGWGGGPCNPQLFNSYDDNDIRKKGTIINVNDTLEGDICTEYSWGEWECQQETGYWQKKYTPIQVYVDGTLKGMYCEMLGSSTNYQLWNMQDEVLIRFADVLLMAAELKEDAAPLNRVRTRAGLDAIGSYSIDALKNERRHELAFEALRYFDLLRWHDAEEAFAKVKDVPIKNNKQDAKYTASFRPETGGFLPIPESQIKLSDGVLKQNPGW